MNAAVLYNDNDPAAAAWLRRLVDAGHLPQGRIDGRPIQELEASDLEGVQHCHLFAGIGGWPLATRLADWPVERELWTASAPCQPFSVIGKRHGADDSRNVWPDAFRLIRSRRPACVMGEQVASTAGLDWFDGIASNLEDIGYAVRAMLVPACSVNAPHKRERLYFAARAVVDASGARLERHGRDDGVPAELDTATPGPTGTASHRGGGYWDHAEWIEGPGRTLRRVKPGVRLLGHGIPGRVERLRGFGNAIVPQLAAELMRAWLEVEP